MKKTTSNLLVLGCADQIDFRHVEIQRSFFTKSSHKFLQSISAKDKDQVRENLKWLETSKNVSC